MNDLWPDLAQVTLDPNYNFSEQLEMGQTIIDNYEKRGENMKKLYKAIIFDTYNEAVKDEQYVTGGCREQAFTKVDISMYTISAVKVFLEEIGSYSEAS